MTAVAERAPAQPRLSRRFEATHALAIIIGVSLAAAVGVAAATGSLAIPHNDAWSYQKVATILWHTGHLRLQGWGKMFLIGQVVTAIPLIAALRAPGVAVNLYGTAAAAVLLYCAYRIAQRCVGGRRAVVAVGCITLFPGFGLLASTFMTDLPCTATALLSLGLGVRAVRRQNLAWWAGCVVVGVWGFTIREQSIAGLAAATATCLVLPRLRSRFRFPALGIAAAGLLVCVPLEHLRHQMPNADLPPWHLSDISFHTLPPTLLPILFTVGFPLAPLALWALATLRGRQWIDVGRVAGWLLGGLALWQVVATRGFTQLTLTNYLTPAGAYAVAGVGSAPAIFGPAVWDVIQGVAAFGGIVIAGELGATLTHPGRTLRQLRTADPAVPALALFGLFTVAGAIVLALMGEQQWDRYFVSLLLPVGVLLVRHRPATHWVGMPRHVAIAVATAVAAFVGLMSWNVTVSTDTRDAVRWSAAAALVAQGVPSRTINAGLEWDGQHAAAPDHLHWHHRLHRERYRGQHWTAEFPGSTDCWIVSYSRLGLPGLRLVTVRTQSPYGLGLGRVHAYVYQRPGCAGAIPAR